MSIIIDTSSLRRNATALRPAQAGAALLVTGIALGMGLLLAQTGLVTSAGYENDRLLDRRAAVEQRNQELAAEIASLQSLDRLESEARSRLGMSGPTQYLYVQVDPALKDPESAAPKDAPGAASPALASGFAPVALLGAWLGR